MFSSLNSSGVRKYEIVVDTNIYLCLFVKNAGIVFRLFTYIFNERDKKMLNL